MEFLSQVLKSKNRLFVFIIGGIIIYLILSIILSKVWPWGADFYYDFYPLARQWLAGHHNIYDISVSKLMYPPWVLFVILPFGSLPIQFAHGFQLVGSFFLIILSLRLLQDSKPLPIYLILLSLLNLQSFDLYIRGQLDAFVLFGIALGFWSIRNRKPFWLSLGFCFMVMKPPLNVSLILLLYIISIRHWKKREILITFTAPIIMVVISSFAVGLDWPIIFFHRLANFKIANFSTISNLSISIWDIAERFNIPYWLIGVLAITSVLYFLNQAWKENLTEFTLTIGLATTFLFTLYANGDHYVLLIPALIFISQKSFRFGLLAFSATFTPLLRLIWGPSLSPVDILYPAILLFGAYYFASRFKPGSSETQYIYPGEVV